MKTSLMLAIALVAEFSSATCITSTVNPNDPNDLLTSFVESIVTLDLARNRYGSIMPETVIREMKLIIEDYSCAKSKLTDFAKSSNSTIRDAATGAESAISILVSTQKEMLDNLISEMNEEGVKVKAGTKASQDADREIAIQKAWKSFLMSTILSTYSAINEATLEKKPRLRISKQQREKLLSELSKFLKSKSKKSDHAIELAAAGLKKFLSDRWLSSDN